MNKKVHFLIVAILISLCTLKAQDQSARQPMPLFQSDEVIYLDLATDFKTVFSVTDDSTWFPAKLTLMDNAGQRTTMEIKIRTRGKTRRESDVCAFPPLRLNFPKKETTNTPFEGQNAIKYLDEFYRIINNDRVVQKEFFDSARIVHN